MSYYDFVCVDSVRRYVLNPDMRLSSEVKNVVVFSFSFRAKTPVHVGSGMKEVRHRGGQVEVVLKHYRNGFGRLVIPGSSFKGAISTNFLALSGSMEDTSNLFGATKRIAIISKVLFSDLTPDSDKVVEKDVLRQWSPRKGKRNCVKFYTGRAPKTEYYGKLECLPEGSRLDGEVVGYNLKPYEVGGLLASAGYGFEGVFKIGYGKPQGFGQMKLEKASVKLVKIRGFKIKEQKFEAENLDEFLHAFEERYSKRKIREIARKVFAEVKV